jgi:DNA repair protein RecN (Recombination protein N)
MLSRLHIKNFALIAHLEVDLSSGLTVITGETGAGKSILLGALNLILGARADLSIARDSEKACVVEGEFRLSGGHEELVKRLLKEADIDHYPECIIRREISPAGRSRAFVNDVPAQLSLLKELGSVLIDIHSQHDTADLFSKKYQLSILDDFSANAEVLLKYQKEFNSYRQIQTELANLMEEQVALERDHEYNQHLYDEFEGISWDLDEAELKNKVSLYESLEHTLEQLSGVYQLLAGGEWNAEQMISEAVGLMKSVHGESDDLQNIKERLISVQAEINDLSSEIEVLQSKLDIDPEEQQQVLDTYNRLEGLKVKHGVSDLADLQEVHARIEEKVANHVNMGQRLKKAEQRQKELRESLKQLAGQLHQRREAQIAPLEAQINRLLSDLGMKDALLRVELEHTDDFKPNGRDQVNMLFRANKGRDFQPLEKTASGGELSRLMLVIKSIQGEFGQLPTMILDEIDTGVSGEIAEKMGRMMHRLSAHHQLIVITHLPQVAAQPGTHWKVSKKVVDDMTYTQVESLDKQERVTEISKMLGGEKPTQAAIANAEDLIGNME